MNNNPCRVRLENVNSSGWGGYLRNAWVVINEIRIKLCIYGKYQSVNTIIIFDKTYYSYSYIISIIYGHTGRTVRPNLR